MGIKTIQLDQLRGASPLSIEGLKSDMAFCYPAIVNLIEIDPVKGIIKIETQDGMSDDEFEDMKKQITNVVDMSVKSFRFVEDISPLWHHKSDKPYYGNKAVQAFTERYLITLGPGQYAFHGAANKLYTFFCNRIQKLAEEVGSEAWHLPSIEMTHDLITETRYLASHPQLVTFGYRLPPHYEKIHSFAEAARAKKLLTIKDSNLLEPTGFILEPFVCHNVYRSLKKEHLINNKTITAQGRCYRFEGFRFLPLLRQWEFSMREIVLVGDKDFVMTTRQRCIELTQTLVDELDLTAHLEVATDPFFVDAAASARTFQMMQSTKLELRLRIDETKTTAAVSFNIHGKHFTQPMEIQDTKGNILETACVAYGIERWMAAFVARWSEDVAKWPISI